MRAGAPAPEPLMEYTATDLTIPTSAGGVEAFLAVPDGPGPHPSVIILHEVFGFTEYPRDVARRFAQMGYAGLAINLFSRLATMDELRDREKQSWCYWMLDDPQAVRDMEAGMAMLREHPALAPDAIGVVGFSMGGRIALLFATYSAELGACVDVYGGAVYHHLSREKPEHPIDRFKHITCPVLAIVADDDPLISIKDRDRMRGELERWDVPHEWVVVEGGKHSFMNHTLPKAYDEERSERAWALLDRFLTCAENLRRRSR